MRPVQPSAAASIVCSTGRRIWSGSRKTGETGRIGLQSSNRIQRRSKSYFGNDQAFSNQGFYAELLKHPLSKIAPATSTAPPPAPAPTPEAAPKTDNEEAVQKARIVFGTRLAGPGERKAEINAASKMIAGVLVPPKPTEPDNCCMSGCVNCVWDMYRDEMEEWAEKSAEARAKLKLQRTTAQKAPKTAGQGTGTMVAEEGTPTHVATSMDDDGGGSEANWDVEEADKEKMFDDIPVGIREFMKTEKKLKLRHKEEDQALNA